LINFGLPSLSVARHASRTWASIAPPPIVPTMTPSTRSSSRAPTTCGAEPVRPTTVASAAGPECTPDNTSAAARRTSRASADIGAAV
jgi:hypothetical protein